MIIYGVITDKGLIDVSKSISYTKRVATMGGYNKIGIRNSNYYHSIATHEKVKGKWVEIPTPTSDL